MKIGRILVSLTLIVSLVGCQFISVKDKHIQRPFKKILAGFQAEHEENPTALTKASMDAAQELLEAVDKAKDTIKHPPKLKGRLSEDLDDSKNFVKKNSDKVNRYFSDIEKDLTAIVQMIHGLGRANHARDPMTRRSLLSDEQKVKNEALIFYSLQFMRNAALESMNIIVPFTLGTYAEAYEGDETMLQFRKKVFERYMAVTGFIVIAERDINRTLKRMKSYGERGELPEYISASIKDVLSRVEKRERKQRKGVSHAIEELNQEQIAKFNVMKAEFLKNFEERSFLFDPRNPDNIPVVIFTWIGNLTWGGINTMIGLGWVVGAALVSPFTRYVDFPTIKLSRSGSQIYADVSGTLMFSGKISLGLFELDHNAGWSFASAHEAGHATQSALLGPLYLPVVFLSYAINMGHGGFIENWADRWAHFHDSRW